MQCIIIILMHIDFLYENQYWINQEIDLTQPNDLAFQLFTEVQIPRDAKLAKSTLNQLILKLHEIKVFLEGVLPVNMSPFVMGGDSILIVYAHSHTYNLFIRAFPGLYFSFNMGPELIPLSNLPCIYYIPGL